jgi:4-amino-4-deoxy-L-arabinose transferase-like glycosyltransferase
MADHGAGTVPTNKGPVVAVVAIMVAGALLRLIGIDHGLPFIYDPDEPDFVERAFRMLESGDFNPHWFGHPGSTTIYLNALLFTAYGAIGIAAGWFASATAVAAAFHAEPSTFYLLARCLTWLAAVGSIMLTWRIAWRTVGAGFALFAIALLAIAPLHVTLSRAARPDMLMTFLMLASACFALRIAQDGRWRDYLGAGLLLGLAAATKYPALTLGLVIVVAHVLRQLAQQRPFWAEATRLMAAGGATLCGAFLGSPFLFLDARTALGNIVGEARSYHLSGTSQGVLHSLGWYLSEPLGASLGTIGLALAALGGWAALRRRNREALLLLAFTVVFLVFISSLPLRWERWALPLVPSLAILAALGLRELWSMARGIGTNALHTAALSAIVVVTLAMPASEALSWTRALAATETRTLARQWILQHVAPGSAILAEAYTPHLPKGRYRLYTVDGRRIWRLDGTERIHVVPRGIIGTLAEAEMIDRAGIDYVVLANHYDRRLWEKDRYPHELAIYEDIMSRHELVYEVWPEAGKAAGLVVRIYRVVPSHNNPAG